MRLEGKIKEGRVLTGKVQALPSKSNKVKRLSGSIKPKAKV